MTDIKCVVCAEPWDAYGVSHGDMYKWEARLFRAGSGCPSCTGVVPNDGGFDPQSIHDLENGDRDPMERIDAFQHRINGTAPKWVRPAPRTLWSCDGCGVNVVVNPDGDEMEYDLPPKAKGRQWYRSHPYRDGLPDAEPAAVLGEQKVCEFCVSDCADCGEKVSGLIDTDDVYDAGWCTSHPHNHRQVLCIECYSARCSSCGDGPDDDDGCSECRPDQEEGES